jgi:hypothetical protein
MNEDVKELLGKAFGQEPPLGIDRDEVLQQGRKRLRRRRLVEAGSVVALVVVVAVGAATLTNFAGSGQEHKLPPAASTTEHAPPGPDLPVPSSAPTTIPTTETSTRTDLPGVAENPEIQLTAILYSTGVFTEDEVSAVPNRTDPPAFRKTGDQYVFEADLRHEGASGYLKVVVDLSPAMIVDCGNVPASDDCEIKNRAGSSITLTHSTGADGERLTRASAAAPSGIWVSVVASNLTRHDRDLDRHPTSDTVVLTDDEVCLLLTKAGMGV